MRVVDLEFRAQALSLSLRRLSRRVPTIMVALGSVLLLAGCSSVRTERAPGFTLSVTDTYAWRASSGLRRPSTGGNDDLPLEEVRQAVDEAFARAGIRQVAPDEADVLADAHLAVERKQQKHDPYYSMYIAKQYEQAVLTIELFDSRTRDRVWLGEDRCRLRFVSRTTGGLIPHTYPAVEERNWQIGDMVARILENFPKGAKRL